MTHHPRRALLATATALALSATLAGPGLAAPAGPAAPARPAAPAAPGAPEGTYTNAVSDAFSDTYADPAVIQGKDGWWYAYATADPLYAGQEPGIGHITRTRDWATWDYVGTIFDDTNRPVWAEESAGLWAPDIRYVDGRYVLYFTVTDTTRNPGEDSAIGVATSADPAGPWVPADEPIVAPRQLDDGRFLWTFDPAGFTSTDGRQWLYYGSYFGGLEVTEVSADGLTPVGEPTQVAINDRYEGAYVVEHDGWYYLMGSSANCCAGPATGYSVFAGRSKDPRGPFLDADGLDLSASVTGGTTVLTQNGNSWVGAGHHSVLTDATGQDFIVYHAIDRDEPWLTDPFGINRRPMLLDRFDWIDGWPRTDAGAGPSEGPQPLPVTTSLLPADPADPATSFTGMSTGQDPQGGDVGVLEGTATSRAKAPRDAARVRLDVRAEDTLTLTLGAHPKKVRVTYDGAAGELRTAVVMGAKKVVDESVTPLPPGQGWRTLTVEAGRRAVTAEVSASDLHDPMAVTGASFPGFSLASAPVTLTGADARVDNLSVQHPATPVTDPAPAPQVGDVIFSDSFDGGLDDTWQWVRPDDGITVADGDLVWPLRSVDAVGGTNTGALLLRDMPEGDWIAETELTLDLGEDTVRNYQQAGLIVHEDDDDFARLGSVAIWNTRTVEYGRELAVAEGDDRTIYAGAIIGAPAPTMSMRIAHTTGAEGEHVYRAGISRDGTSWVWGAAWTFPAGTDPRLGLYAGGGAEPPVDARFHELTVYESAP
ncbi:family 43 glycosylhydrolase [uncultured Serinicoccus sp.]|uniref:family 43 glycosylhydrolase n=1 Tax=uncultured Serinicoccus sp. TaxID=735514 RepID=UPI002630363F|nr:family 43 glycosylhydrolase [uncultured Serinicoccus sp.]